MAFVKTYDHEKSIAIIVNNSCTYDGRVIKEAEALADRGYNVMVFAVSEAGLPSYCVQNGVKYRRLPKTFDPSARRFLTRRASIFEERKNRSAKDWLLKAVLNVLALFLLFFACLQKWHLIQDAAPTSDKKPDSSAAPASVSAEVHTFSERGAVNGHTGPAKGKEETVRDEQPPKGFATEEPSTSRFQKFRSLYGMADSRLGLRARLSQILVAKQLGGRRYFYSCVELTISLLRLCRKLLVVVRRKSKALVQRYLWHSSPHNALLSASTTNNSRQDAIAPALNGIEKESRIYALTQWIQTRFDVAVEAFRPDIIHCHDLDCLPASASFAAKAGCPFIYDVHEFETHRPDREQALERFATGRIEGAHIGKAAAVITVSDSLAAELNKFYNVKPHVIYNTPRLSRGVPSDRNLRSEVDIPETAILAVYTGVLALGRGLERFVEAMGDFDDLHLAMVGKLNETPRQVLSELGKQQGVFARMHFVNPVHFDAVSPFIASADFGVIPALSSSKNQEFGLPNKLFEMIFAGIPVLLGDIAQRKEFLLKYGDGVLFPNAEDVALKPYIEKMLCRLQDPSFKELCRSKGIAANAVLGWDHQMEPFAELYRSLLMPDLTKGAYHASPVHTAPITVPRQNKAG